MSATKQVEQTMMMRVKNSGLLNYSSSGSPLNDEKEEEMTRSALTAFRAKEEEIERKKAEVRERVQAQLGRVEEETKKLAEIREVSPRSTVFSAAYAYIYIYIELNLLFSCKSSRSLKLLQIQ